LVFIIGIDPHKGLHTAAVIGSDEQMIAELSVRADRRQRDRLLCWATPFAPRVCAIEGASGVGALVARQLVAAGETVVDVPAVLSARARLLDAGRNDKTDSHERDQRRLSRCAIGTCVSSPARFSTFGSLPQTRKRAQANRADQGQSAWYRCRKGLDNAATACRSKFALVALRKRCHNRARQLARFSSLQACA
jgi:Transposase